MTKYRSATEELELFHNGSLPRLSTCSVVSILLMEMCEYR